MRGQIARLLVIAGFWGSWVGDSLADVGDPPGALRGVVTSIQTGTPLPRVELSLLDASAATPLRVVTDREGAFVFVGLEEGDYLLAAEGEDYAAAEPLWIHVSSGHVALRHVVLWPVDSDRAREEAASVTLH